MLESLRDRERGPAQVQDRGPAQVQERGPAHRDRDLQDLQVLREAGQVRAQVQDRATPASVFSLGGALARQASWLLKVDVQRPTRQRF
jgi:hypothetical protein